MQYNEQQNYDNHPNQMIGGPMGGPPPNQMGYYNQTPQQQQQQQFPPQQQIQMGRPVGPPPNQNFGAGVPVHMIVNHQQDLMLTHANNHQYPVQMVCPHCKREVNTFTSMEVGVFAIAWIWVIMMICPICAWIPCCYDNCKDKVHRCPSCNKEVGYADQKCCFCPDAWHGNN